MNSFTLGVCASVVASGITYLVFTATDAISPPLRLLLVVFVMAVGVAAAWWVSRAGQAPRSRAATSVGSEIEAEGDIAVERVKSAGVEGDVEIGSGLDAGRNVSVKDIEITGGEGRE